MDISLLGFQFLNPLALALIPVAIGIIIFILVKKSLPVETEKQRKARNVIKFITFTARILIAIALLIAIAQPFKQELALVSGDPKVTLLIDNSSSFSVYDKERIEGFVKDIKTAIPTTEVIAGFDTTSDIGDSIVGNLRADENLLLISDGYVTTGSDLEEARDLAINLNASISSVNLEPIETDLSVVISGPSKTVKDLENTYDIYINKVNFDGLYHLVVKIDDQKIIDKHDDITHITFKRTFEQGDHKISAQITPKDPNTQEYFSENNVYLKTVHVVERPKVLLVTTKPVSRVKQYLEELYDVDTMQNIPEQLDQYYTAVIEDMYADSLHNIDKLTEFVNDGNGLLVIGGMNSFDYGGYQNSQIEPLLPVNMGSGEKKEGDVNVVILLDISRSSGYSIREGSTLKRGDFEKALALNIIKGIDQQDNVGVVVFNDEGYVVSPLSLLRTKMSILDETIPRLQFAGSTFMAQGLSPSYAMLREQAGSKNLVIISDGAVTDSNKYVLYEAARTAFEQDGVRTYTVGVGPKTKTKFMKRMAQEGNGVYLDPDESNKLRVIFGDPEELESEGKANLVILNKDHFITQDIDEIGASLSGYNEVVPKTSGQVLVSLDTGHPALTVWRVGLGRVATINAFSSSGRITQLLTSKNSRLISRILNWGIANPERNKDYYVDISDSKLGEIATIDIKSDKPPKAQDIVFTKIENNMYKATFRPTEIGFMSVLDYPFAINYPAELMILGNMEPTKSLVKETGGMMFEPGETDNIVDFITTRSKRYEKTKVDYMWPFAIIALILFLCEVCVRRIITNWLS